MEVAATGSPTLASVRALIAGSIDYAGLFPPAQLSMPEAVINYATYRNSNYNWVLGRFVVTAARLDEFIESARDFVSRDAGSGWHVSVVAGDDAEGTLARLADLNSSDGTGIIYDAVEIKADEPALIETLSGMLPEGVDAYFELPLDERLPDLVSTLAITGQRAKIRTGGITPEAFPLATDVIRFVRTCLAANVLFKATAGLHHPIRCFRPLTYESGSVSGTMHGFLNLFLMTGFARQGFPPQLLEEVMEEEFGEVFRFDDESAVWRDEFTLNLRQIERLRSHGIQSFGSCSFDEPIADLERMGML